MDILPKDLIADIDRFLGQRGISATMFGKKAVNDGHFVQRLRQGANMRLSTIQRAHAYLISQVSCRSDDAA